MLQIIKQCFAAGIVLLGRGVLLLGILSHESEVVSGCPEKLLAEMLLHIEI